MPVTFRSFAKINLGLAIGLARPDGYHGLATVYQTIAACDLVTVRAARAAATRLLLTTNDPRVPTDQRNTAWKMAERAMAALRVSAEIEIHIEKRLPVQGGLGAGSANAAAALLGLEAELGMALPPDERLAIAGEVGSDVPLFLLGGTVLGLGRGEEVYPLPELTPDGAGVPCVIAVPAVGVSTPAAFREWDSTHVTLTPDASAGRLRRLSRSVSLAWSQPHSSGVSGADSLRTLSREEEVAQSGDLAETPLLALVRTGIANDFEEVVFRQHPSLADILRVLAAPGQGEDAALYAALSGSGSALFGLYANDESADRAANRLELRGVVALRTRTLPRQQYWRTMREST